MRYCSDSFVICRIAVSKRAGRTEFYCTVKEFVPFVKLKSGGDVQRERHHSSGEFFKLIGVKGSEKVGIVCAASLRIEISSLKMNSRESCKTIIRRAVSSDDLSRMIKLCKLG